MTRKCRGVIALALSTALVLSVLAGCGASPQKSEALSVSSRPVIDFGYITADQLHSPAVMVMKENKLLEEEGFDVEWHEYIAGAYAIQDLTAGKIDFANCGIAPIIISNSRKPELSVIAGSNREGSSLIVRESIKSVTDLSGKTIATPGLGSIQDAMITSLALKNGITIKHTTIEVPDMPDFLKRGEIDGFIAWAPHPAAATAKKLGYELLTSGDMMPKHQCCVMVTNKFSGKSGCETVEKVLKVYLAAYDWFLKNREESIKMMVKTTGLSEKIIRQAIDTVDYSYPPYCNEDSIKSIALGLIEAGRISMKNEALDAFVEDLYQPGLMEEITGTKRPD